MDTMLEGVKQKLVKNQTALKYGGGVHNAVLLLDTARLLLLKEALETPQESDMSDADEMEKACLADSLEIGRVIHEIEINFDGGHRANHMDCSTVEEMYIKAAKQNAE